MKRFIPAPAPTDPHSAPGRKVRRPLLAAMTIGALLALVGNAAAAPAEPVALEKEAAAGNAEAQFALGQYYWQQAKEDPAMAARAVEWWTAAARQMHVGAIFALGNAVAEGRGVPRSPSRAAELWRHAAEAGHPGAMTALGRAYARGFGTAPNDTEAVRWFQRAAAKGDAEAEFYLGWHYETGRGTEADPVQAAICYLNAAEQNIPAAQTRIGLCYANGTGVPRNLATAHLWLARAAAAGDPDAPALQRTVERQMGWRERRRALARWAEFQRRAAPNATDSSIPVR
jgi:hypothetical protein